MPREEFTIRITKKGEILVEFDGLPARRVKDLVRYFEETIGPSRVVEGDADGSRSRLQLEEDALREIGQEPEEKSPDRLRIEDGK